MLLLLILLLLKRTVGLLRVWEEGDKEKVAVIDLLLLLGLLLLLLVLLLMWLLSLKRRKKGMRTLTRVGWVVGSLDGKKRKWLLLFVGFVVAAVVVSVDVVNQVQNRDEDLGEGGLGCWEFGRKEIKSERVAGRGLTACN